MRFQVEVNREDCIACANCYTIDPGHFESDNEGKSKVLGGTSNGKSAGTFDDEKMSDAKMAEEMCPVSVITVAELKT